MAPALRVAALSLMLVAFAAPAAAINYVISPVTGGNCGALGGFWISNSDTCLLFTVTIDDDDTLVVLEGATAQIQGSLSNYGIVLNEGTIHGVGTIWNYASFTNENTVEVDGFLVNEIGGSYENHPAAEMHGGPASNVVNYGELLNPGLISLQVDEALPSAAFFFNSGTVTNPGLFLGGATQTHPGSTLYNSGSFDNASGVLRDTLLENAGQFDGGLIDDTGGAAAFVVNQAGATIRDAEITKVSIDNFGTLDNHTLGSGTIVNAEGALIRANGGQAFLVFNDGVIDLLGDVELFNNFTNNAPGVLVNRAEVLSHTHLVNHGLLDNRGLWINDGASAGQGVIENHGTLLNAATISQCGQAPDVEQVNNHGLLSNGGSITGCGSTNFGSWYQCSLSELPGGLPVTGGVDADGDRVCAPVDCADDDPQAWATASEVGTLDVDRLEPGPAQLRWSGVHYTGGDPPRYDLLAATDAGDLLGSGSCAASGVPGHALEDPTPDVPGSLLYFLVRVAGCPGNSAGFDSAGAPRSVPDCP
jgi:hypothetical protein